MMIPTHQATAIQRLLPKGRSSVKALKLSMTGVMGCISANHLMPPSNELTGTNPELIKGKMKSGSISPLEPSTVFESSPHITASSEIAMFTNVRSPVITNQSRRLPCGLKPRINAVAMIVMVEIVFLLPRRRHGLPARRLLKQTWCENDQ